MPHCFMEFIEFLRLQVPTFIALSALFVSVYSAYSTRKHHRLSCRPQLDTWIDEHDENGRKSVRLELTNNGIGPARVKGFDVYVDEVRIVSKDPIHTAMLGLLGDQKNLIKKTSHFRAGYCIGVQDRITLLDIEVPGNDSAIVERIRKAARLVIQYESFYNEAMPALDTQDFEPLEQSFTSNENKI